MKYHQVQLHLEATAYIASSHNYKLIQPRRDSSLRNELIKRVWYLDYKELTISVKIESYNLNELTISHSEFHPRVSIILNITVKSQCYEFISDALSA
jgi:hypothetical protein